MAVVTFDSDEFLGIYPRFAGVLTTVQLQNAFDTACLMLDNTDESIVPYDPDNGIKNRKTLLYMLTCHLASIALWGNGQAGPVSGASEGSVSVSFAVPDVTTASWYKLTPCGASYFQVIKKYIVGGRYIAQKYYHPWG